MSSVVGSLKVLLGLDAADYITGLTKADALAAQFSEKQKRNAAGIDRQVAALRQQAVQLGKTAREVKLMELAQKGATEAQLKAANAALRQVEVYNALQTVTAAVKTASLGIAAGFLLMIDSQSKAIDKFNDLSDATGASIENISALEDIARRTGGTFETVETALLKFNQTLQNAKPNDDASRVLTAIGLSVGELKALDPAEAFLQTALALDKFADDGDKGRATMELFSKALKEIGPLLKDVAEKGQLVAKTTTEQAKAAEEFQKNLLGLKANAEDLARSLVNTLVPATNASIEAFRRARAEGAGFFSAFATLQATYYKTLLGLSSSGDDQAKRTAERVETLNKLLQEGNLTVERRVRLERQLAGLVGQQQQGSIDALRRMDRDLSWAPDKPQLKVPDKPVTGGPDLLKIALDRQIKAIEDFAQQQRDGYDFANRYAEGAFEQGLVDLRAYFEAQKAIRAAQLSATVEALDKEEAAVRAYAAKPGVKAAEREAAEDKIRDAVARRAAAVQKASQDEILAAQAQASAVTNATRRYEELRAQIAELQGDSAGAAAIRRSLTVDDARNTIKQAGGDPAQAEALNSALRRMDQLSELQKQYNLTLERTAMAEDEVRLASQAAGDSENETLRKVGEARRLALEQMRAMVIAARALADAPGATEDAIRYAEQLGLAYKKAAAEIDPLLEKQRTLAKEISGTFEDAIVEGLRPGAKVSEVVASLGQSIVDQLNRELLAKPAANWLQNFLGGTGQEGGFLSGLFGASGSKSGSGNSEATKTAGDALRLFEASVTQSSAKSDSLGESLLSVVAGNSTVVGSLTSLTIAAEAAATALSSVAGTSAASSAGSGGGFWSGLLDMAVGWFTGGSSGMTVDTGGLGLTSGGTSLASLGLGGGRAGGGPVLPGSLHEVAEKRPELLDVNGRKFLLMGSQRGNIDPNPREVSRQRTVINAPISVNVPSGTSAQTANQVGSAIALRLRRAQMRNA